MTTGIIFGKFYPIHLGHVFMIEQASQYVERLVLIVGCDSNRDAELFQQSAMRSMPSPEQRISWIRQIFALNDKIEVHLLIEDGIPRYPNGWQSWAERVNQLLTQLNLKFDIIFSSEPQDVDLYQQHFHTNTKIIDHRRSNFDISATQVRNNPLNNWHLLPHNVRGFFARNINLLNPNKSLLGDLDACVTLAISLGAVFNGQVLLDPELTSPQPLQLQSASQFEEKRLVTEKVFFSNLSLASLKKYQLHSDLFIVLVNNINQFNQEEQLIVDQLTSSNQLFELVVLNQQSLCRIIKIVRALIKYNLNLDII